MATLDDKILGEKREYYCSSSSEDEAGDEDNERPSELNLSNQWEPSYPSTLLSPSESATNVSVLVDCKQIHFLDCLHSDWAEGCY